MEATVNVNGVVTDGNQAVVSVFDHGFLYGDGVYETLRTYNGVPFAVSAHLDISPDSVPPPTVSRSMCRRPTPPSRPGCGRQCAVSTSVVK